MSIHFKPGLSQHTCFYTIGMGGGPQCWLNKHTVSIFPEICQLGCPAQPTYKRPSPNPGLVKMDTDLRMAGCTNIRLDSEKENKGLVTPSNTSIPSSTDFTPAKPYADMLWFGSTYQFMSMQTGWLICRVTLAIIQGALTCLLDCIPPDSQSRMGELISWLR